MSGFGGALLTSSLSPAPQSRSAARHFSLFPQTARWPHRSSLRFDKSTARNRGGSYPASTLRWSRGGFHQPLLASRSADRHFILSTQPVHRFLIAHRSHWLLRVRAPRRVLRPSPALQSRSAPGTSACLRSPRDFVSARDPFLASSRRTH